MGVEKFSYRELRSGPGFVSIVGSFRGWEGFRVGFGFRLFHDVVRAGPPPTGIVHHTDGNPENTKRPIIISRSRAWVRSHVGDALESLAKTPGNLDIYYCDIDKEGYPDAYRAISHRIKPGNMVITDNCSLGQSGPSHPDAETRAIMKYTRLSGMTGASPRPCRPSATAWAST